MKDVSAGDLHPAAAARPRRFSRHLFGLVLASTLPFVLLTIGLSIWAGLEERRQRLEAMSATAQALQVAVEGELRVAGATLRGLARSPTVARAIAAGPDGSDGAIVALHRQASELAADRRDAISSIVLYDVRSVRQIMNTLRSPEAVPGIASAGLRTGNPETRPLAAGFEHVARDGEVYVSDIYRGPVSGEYHLGVMLPVERAGEIAGVLVINIRPESIGAVLREQMPEIGYVASVVDRAGVIIARTSNEARYVGQFATREVRDFQQSGAPALLRRSLTADGAEVYGAFRQLESVPWAVAFGAPRAVVDGPVRRAIFLIGGAVTLATGLFTAVAVRQGRRLDREIATLAAEAGSIGRGTPAPEHHDRILEVAETRAALRSGVAALSASEERMRLAIEGSGMATWDLDVESGRIVWEGHFREMLGLPPAESHEGSVDLWLDRVDPEDRGRLAELWSESARERTRLHAIYRILRADDGAQRWLESFGTHIRDGRHHRFIGVTFDVTERRTAEEQHKVLMREVDHRAKNALAVVHSVVRLTRSDDAAQFAQSVEGRVRALARAHDLLAQDRWKGAGLRALVSEGLAAQIATGRVVLGGPDVRLGPEAVQPLSMVLHELATNALKYGALSGEAGSVRIAWRFGRDGALVLRWHESDGPAVARPDRLGFGARLIAATVQGQLGGAAEFDWRPEGLVCDVTIAADRVARGPNDEVAVPDPPKAPEECMLEGARVLVVEDEALIAAELALSLADAGCKLVGPAATRLQAEALAAERGRIDAAVLDVNLGGESALPIAEALMAREVPIVVVTGYSQLPSGWESLGTPAAVLQKPVDPDVLLATLQRAIGDRRAEA